MHVFLNHRFVPEAEATVSVADRGFLYGDGLFETIRVARGRLFRWEQHLARLARGADFLHLRVPLTNRALGAAAAELLRLNALTEGILRLQVSRGVGPRGYSPRGAGPPTTVMTTHALPVVPGPEPVRWRLRTASFRVPHADPTGGFKTTSKLLNIVARAEAEASAADEALLLDPAGRIVETAGANLFWIEGGELRTPPASAGALPGITRAVVLELCAQAGLSVQERSAPSERLRSAEGTFLTLSSLGIVEGLSLDGLPLKRSPLVSRLHQSYQALLYRD